MNSEMGYPTRQWEPDEDHRFSFITGVSLAVLSSIFIGSSFIIKKLSLVRLSRKGALRAGSGGFGYLKDWTWWLGFLTMGVGELSNFAAYTFAPASLVTPLGALSVLVSAILASKFLKEGLNCLGKLGCLLCIVGAIILIIHSPKEQEVKSVAELIKKLYNPIFLNYIIIIVAMTLLIIFYIGPKWGHRHVLVYITVCAGVGSLTVMACKGLGLAITEALIDNNSASLRTAAVLCLIVVICIVVQMNYLNKALDLFSTSVVTPVYYVLFTILVIVASSILFNEWHHMSAQDIVGSLCGFLVVIVAIFLLQEVRTRAEFEEGKWQKSGGKSEFGSNGCFIPRKM